MNKDHAKLGNNAIDSALTHLRMLNDVLDKLIDKSLPIYTGRTVSEITLSNNSVISSNVIGAIKEGMLGELLVYDHFNANGTLYARYFAKNTIMITYN